MRTCHYFLLRVHVLPRLASPHSLRYLLKLPSLGFSEVLFGLLLASISRETGFNIYLKELR